MKPKKYLDYVKENPEEYKKYLENKKPLNFHKIKLGKVPDSLYQLYNNNE